MTRRTTLFAISLLGLLGCGGAPPPVQPAPIAPASVEVRAPDRPWSEMDSTERKRWMNDAVVPAMQPLWEAHDADRFASFGCETCHGESMVEREFALPNPDILPLHPTGSSEQRQMVADHPEMVRFMFNRVLPTMQKLLGASEYDASTKQGFSCYACHPAAASEQGTL